MRFALLLALSLAVPAFAQDDGGTPGFGETAVMLGPDGGGAWSVVCATDGGPCALVEGKVLPEVKSQELAAEVQTLLRAAKDGKIIFAIVLGLRLLLWIFIALLRLRMVKPLLERIPALKAIVTFLDNDWAYWALPLGLSVTSALISWFTVPNTAALEDVLIGAVILGLAAAGKTPEKKPVPA